MLINQVIYDVKTGETRIEKIEIPEVENMPNQEVQLSIEERVAAIEKQVSNQSIILSEEVNKVE